MKFYVPLFFFISVCFWGFSCEKAPHVTSTVDAFRLPPPPIHKISKLSDEDFLSNFYPIQARKHMEEALTLSQKPLDEYANEQELEDTEVFLAK